MLLRSTPPWSPFFLEIFFLRSTSCSIIMSKVETMVWIVSARNASLADYMTMVSFMAKDFVTEAFATYCHRNGGLLQLCFLLNEDVDVAKWFPIYSVEYCEWEGKCNQPVTINGCMLLGMHVDL